MVSHRIKLANKVFNGNTSAVIAYCQIKGEKENIPTIIAWAPNAHSDETQEGFPMSTIDPISIYMYVYT